MPDEVDRFPGQELAAIAPLPARAERLERLAQGASDVVVVGGGITGAGIALDLALRGVRVALVERGDWAGATSCASSRLVHGGLRYLEQFHLGLVRESCRERALLLRNAAGLVWPERFVFPVRRGDRVGRLTIGAGLWLYTALSLPRALGLPALLSRARAAALVPGIDPAKLRGAGAYLDAATDDARLTLAIVASAIDAGATALSRVEALAVEPAGPAHDGARVRVRDRVAGGELELACRAVVLCGGPFTDELRARAGLGGAGRWIAPTRGSHIVVPRERLPTDGAVIFPSDVDGRVMFLIPWPRFTVVGTTDLDADPSAPPRATPAEVRYLLDSANGLVPAARLGEDDVVSTYSGLRPLLAADDSPSARSREERITREGPLYTIAGGKLTGYRSMAEKLAARLTADTGLGRSGRRSPTRDHRLRGALAAQVSRPRWSSLENAREDPLAAAFARRYGERSRAVRAWCASLDGGERPLDPETLCGEVDWSVVHDDCLALDDFFFRRTDLGYGPRAAVEACVERVLERLAQRLGWDAGACTRERSTFERELALRHAWRDERAS